jgi:hypothetical protein
MRISVPDREQLAYRLIHDLAATVGPGHEHVVHDNIERHRHLGLTRDDYVQRVVDAAQQDMHDLFIDTDWPRCPKHPHPMWFRAGGWWCEKDQIRVADLGALDTLLAG